MSTKDRFEKYVNGQYQCKKKLGSGGFGEVWSCIDLLAASKSQSKVPEDFIYAMKIEHLQDSEQPGGKDDPPKKVPVPSSQSQLLYEEKMYKVLQDGIGIPQVHWFGEHKERNVLVMDNLGASLEELFRKC